MSEECKICGNEYEYEMDNNHSGNASGMCKSCWIPIERDMIEYNENLEKEEK